MARYEEYFHIDFKDTVETKTKDIESVLRDDMLLISKRLQIYFARYSVKSCIKADFALKTLLAFFVERPSKINF
jgi:hypothetical protein